MKSLLTKIIRDDNFLSLAASFTTATMGLLSFMFLVRVLPMEEFGKWVIFTTLASLVDMMRFGLAKEALVRFLTGSSEQDKRYLIGSSWIISILMMGAISVLLWTILLLFPGPLKDSGYDLFFYWYPLLGFLNLPWNYAWSILQSQIEFGKIFWVRFVSLCSFLVVIILAYLLFTIDIRITVYIYLISNLATSLFCIFNKWSGLEDIKHITREKIKTLLDFGRYTMLTRLGSSMLKGADSLIISFSAFLGPTAVAIYAIPLKYIELIEIPLLSFATTAFPKLSKASMEGKTAEFKRIFYSYTGFIAYLFILIAILSFIFRDYFLLFLGGSNFRDILPEVGLILLPFIIYGMLLPLDRFTGVALDSLNKPEKNFYKVIIMTSTNIIGDLFAVFGLHYLFPEWEPTTILMFVSMASVLFALIGLYVGYWYMRQVIDISLLRVFTNGFDLYREQYYKWRDRMFKKA